MKKKQKNSGRLWSSAVVQVRKTDGQIPACTDYCKLNVVTQTDPWYYMPTVDETVSEADWCQQDCKQK